MKSIAEFSFTRTIWGGGKPMRHLLRFAPFLAALCIQGCIQPLTMDGDAGLMLGGPVDFTLGLEELTVTEEDYATKVDPMSVESNLSFSDSIHVVMVSALLDESAVDSLGNPLTKGALASSIAGFKVFGYEYVSWSASCTPNIGILQNINMSAASGYYWPSDGKHLRFFAVSDGSSNGLNCVTTSMTSSTAGMPSFTYTPTTAGEDILIADSGDKASGTVSMSFSHIMAALDFVVTGFPSAITVKEIRLNANGASAFKTGGTYTFGSGWSALTSGSLSSSFNTSVAANASVTVTGSSNKFFVPAQTIAANSVFVTVRLTTADSSNNDGYMECYLPAMSFVAGRRYTFYIAPGGFTPNLSITDGSDFTASTATAETKTVGTVYSYLTTSGKVGGTSTSSCRIPVPWVTEYSEDGGHTWSTTRPSWLSAATASGTGGSAGEALSMTRAARTVVDVQSDAYPLGSLSGVTDLSTLHSIHRTLHSRQTANCYIVHGSGKYKIPLVYGNGIVYGHLYPDSYTRRRDSGRHHNLKNAYGRDISSPSIYTDIVVNGNTGGATAALGNCTWIYQSKPNLVYVTPTVSASNDEVVEGATVKFLEFEVLEDNLDEGNCIIGILKPGSTTEFLWSWHIWIVAQNKPCFHGDGSVSTGLDWWNTYKNGCWILNSAVGELSPRRTGYERKACKVRIRAGSTSSPITVEQGAHYTGTPAVTDWNGRTYSSGNFNLYIFGRKDPMFGYTNSAGYNPNTPFEQLEGGHAMSAGEAVSKPYKVGWSSSYDERYKWYTDYDTWDNLWNRNSITDWNWDQDCIGKTAYDPSPGWYTVPTLQFARGFINGSENTSNNLYQSGNFSSNGSTGFFLRAYYGDYLWWEFKNCMNYWSNTIYNSTNWAMDLAIYTDDNNGISRNSTAIGTLAYVRPQYWGEDNDTYWQESVSDDSITSYDNPSVSVSYGGIAATGGTVYPSVSYSQTVHWASGKTTTVTGGGSVSYGGSASGFTVNSSNGAVTAGTNSGGARSVTVTATVTVNGKSGSGSTSVTQAADYITWGETPTVSVSYGGFSAASGTNYPSVSYSQTAHWASGKTTTVTSGGSVSYGGSASGFALDGSSGALTAYANESESGRSITVTAYVTLNGASGSASTTVSQSGDSISSYGTPSVTVREFDIVPLSQKVGTDGGYDWYDPFYITFSATQTVYWVSGKTTTEIGGSVSYSISAGSQLAPYVSVSTDVNGRYYVTASYGSGAPYSGSFRVVAMVTKNGKTGTGNLEMAYRYAYSNSSGVLVYEGAVRVP